MKQIQLSIFVFFLTQNQTSYSSVVRPTHFPQTTFKYVNIPSFYYYLEIPLSLSEKALNNVWEERKLKIKDEESRKKEKELFDKKKKDILDLVKYGITPYSEDTFSGHGFGYEIEIPFRTWLTGGFSIMTKFAIPNGFFQSYPNKRIGVDLTFFPRFQIPLTDYRNFFSSFYIKPALGMTSNIIFTNLPEFLIGGEKDPENNKKLKEMIFEGALTRADPDRGDEAEIPNLPIMGLGFPLQAEAGFDFYIGQWFSLTAGYSFTWLFLLEFALNFSNDGELKEFIDGLITVNTYEHAIHIGIKSTYF